MAAGNATDASGNARLSDIGVFLRQRLVDYWPRNATRAPMINRFHFACLTLICLALGCQRSQSLAPTYPVTGKVAYKNGDVLTEGSVQFVSVTDPKIVATGNIKDGSFTLATLLDRERVPGVVEGEHLIRILLPQGADQAPPTPLRLSMTKCKVEAKANDFVIEIEKR